MEKIKFKVCIPNYFMNCEYIHPLQQRKVAELIDYLSKDDNVNKIIIFGSSVTDKCHNYSDVDFYLDLKEDKRVISKAFDFVFDKLTNFIVDDRLMKEINNKGVVVYER